VKKLEKPLFIEFKFAPGVDSIGAIELKLYHTVKDVTMDLRLTPLSSVNVQALRPQGLQSPMGTTGAPAAGGVAKGNFVDAFKAALDNVNAAENKSTALQTQVQMGNPNVSLEETMLAMQKAQIGFTAALNVRNRMMQAYTDVMNMSV